MIILLKILCRFDLFNNLLQISEKSPGKLLLSVKLSENAENILDNEILLLFFYTDTFFVRFVF